MPITLTVTGHNEIIASLQNLNDRLDGPEVVQKLGQMTSAILEQSTPRGRRGDAGKLQRTMSEIAGPEPTGQGWWMGVGNLEGIYPLEPTPKGTIAAFLERIGKGKKGTGKRKTGSSFNPKHAWHYLSDDEKNQLRAMREAGIEDVGGRSPYRPFYWHIQEEGQGDVGIRGQHYIARAIRQIKVRIAHTIQEVLYPSQVPEPPEGMFGVLG